MPQPRPIPFPAGRPATHAMPGSTDQLGDRDDLRQMSDDDFLALRVAYRLSGGVDRGRDLARRLDGSDGRGDLRLARLIDGGEAFSFVWRDEVWLPTFQLSMPAGTVWPGVRRVTAELATSFDGGAIAAWYVQANSWLAAQRPLDLLSTDISAVLQAARADGHAATADPFLSLP